MTLTALVAASAMVFAACSSSPGQSTPSSSSASSSSTPAASGSSSAAPVSSGAPSSGAATSGAATSGAPQYTPQPAGSEGCGKPHGPYTDPGEPKGAVTTGSAELATSWNNITSHGNSVYNANPQYLTQAQENYYDKDLNLVNNDQFIQCVVVSKSPLTVKYTINAAAKWSDGVPVTAADLILAWGAQSGNFNTGEVKTDKDGNPIANTSAVAFDSQSQGLALITKFPEASADNKSLTVVYDEPFVDYALNLTVGVPAHVTAMHALGMTDAAAATTALVAAFKNKKTADLVKIANFWNTGFDFTALPSDKSLYLSDGAYLLTDFKANQYMTFTANPDYTWGPKPTVKTITYQYLPDATAAVQAIANGEVAIYEPEHPTADTTKGLAALSGQGVKYSVGVGGSYEHVDLVFNNGGPFDPKTYGGDATKALEVRQAFLKVIPRQGILDRLVKPINPSAVLRDSFTQVPGSPLYDTVTKSNGMSAYDTVDIAGAKALLAKAGVTNLKVRFLYSATNPVRGQEFALIAASAKEAGITLVDGKDPNWSSNLPNIAKYDASLFAWQNTNLGIAQIPPNYLGKDSVSKTWGQNNYGQFNNAQVNKDMTTLNVTSDPTKQNKLIESTEKELVANAFGTILYQYPDIVGYDSTKISNVSSVPVSPGVFYNFWEWKLAGS
ncbi:ABC transporter substrate-binding protein [Nakamurella panacisegetis]|uniref:ABC transporter substrate-binding protein n=1 Tax=Nakamurella panacisegetis TaxID=1090615 RepID=UPI0012FDF507|nr:ABC transporter substrate-binding protein [Nakamurella panacisegetis]